MVGRWGGYNGTLAIKGIRVVMKAKLGASEKNLDSFIVLDIEICRDQNNNCLGNEDLLEKCIPRHWRDI
jgi:hypothetical protein